MRSTSGQQRQASRTGTVFRAVARKDKVWGRGITQNVVWYVVKTCWREGWPGAYRSTRFAADLREAVPQHGGELEQIQFLLGHASVQTTERHLGCKQNLRHPVNDLFHLEVIAAACTITGSAAIEKPGRIVYEHGVSSDQEGADARTSARNAGNGNSPV